MAAWRAEVREEGTAVNPVIKVVNGAGDVFPLVCLSTFVCLTRCRFRDRAALLMMVVPLLLFLGMRRADEVRRGVTGATDHTYTPGLMTGA